MKAMRLLALFAVASASIADALNVVNQSPTRSNHRVAPSSSRLTRSLEDQPKTRSAVEPLRTIPTTMPSAAALNSGASSRRSWLHQQLTALPLSVLGVVGAVTAFATAAPQSASADFTPGGSIVDRSIGVTVGNADASPSRKFDNSNVLFDKDYYYKFGRAAPWLEPDSTAFPKTMPYTTTQQRYDALKKYRARVVAGLAALQALEETAAAADIADPAGADVYQLRPMGLLANGLLASENTAPANELFLARYYVNEVFLLVGDLRRTGDPAERRAKYDSVVHAANSYLTLLNRVVTPKVGDKFAYL